MPYRGEYQFLTKEQLEKLTTKRLLNINRTLNPILGRMLDPDDGTVACGFVKESIAQKYREYSALLHEILAQREHVQRPTDKLWRTLIRVEFIAGREAHVVVPAWDSKQVVKVKLSQIPEHIKSHLYEGKRLHARVNIGADEAKDLRFSDWERK